MTTERERLTKEIAKRFPWLPIHGEDRIADFVIADRKSIVAPLVNHKKLWCGNWSEYTAGQAIDETLKLAGEL